MWSFGVPNVPCGVERGSFWMEQKEERTVPNVPCGVESSFSLAFLMFGSSLFLMYRVELKVQSQVIEYEDLITFLMYRVELKGRNKIW